MEPLKIDADIVALIISGISLAISFFIFLRDCWHERFRVKATVVKWFASHVSNYPFFIWMVVQNDSKLPCSIIKMEIEFERNGHPIRAVGHGNKELISTVHNDDQTREIYSLDYPLTIDGYQSVGGYFHFRSDIAHFNFEDQTVTLKIVTNRGVKKQKIELKFGDNIMRAMQHRLGEINVTHDSAGNPIIFTTEEL